MASNFGIRLGQMIAERIADRFKTPGSTEAPPAEAQPAPAEAQAAPAEAQAAPAAAPEAAAPAPEAPATAEAPAVEQPAPEAAGASAAEAVPTAEQPPADATADMTAYPQAEPSSIAEAPAAPQKTAEELEEERLWGEVDQAWAANDFTHVTVLLDQLKVLQPEDAAEIDQKVAAAQYNAASHLEQEGQLERALFLYQDAQRRDPNLGEAGFAIERVQAALQPQAAAPAAEPAPAQQTYTVAEGDTLSAVAERFYGDANAWNRIFEANRDQLDNPDVIYPGQELRIPQA